MFPKSFNITFWWSFTYEKVIIKTLDKSDLILIKMHIFQKNEFSPNPMIYILFVNKLIDPHSKKLSLFRNVNRMKHCHRIMISRFHINVQGELRYSFSEQETLIHWVCPIKMTLFYSIK